MRCRRLWIVLLVLICPAVSENGTAARADITRAIVEAGKRATAFVETKEGTGTAFCIDAEGIFVTNQHVVGNNQQVTLILNSSEKDQKTVSARVVERDAALDLVLLKAEGAGPWKPIPLAPNNDALFETMPLVAFGFPYGKELALTNGQYPSVTVSTGRVTALRKNAGALAEIQVDASLTSGSSGGPVLDEQGRVVGIVVKGIKGAGINFAIPVEHLQFLLLRPHIALLSGVIPRSKAHAPNTLRFRVTPWNGRHVDYQVSFTRDPNTDHARKLPVQSGENSTYLVTTVPLPEQEPSANVRLIITNRDGVLTAITKDREIHVGTQKVRLRDVARIMNSTRSERVHLNTGKVIFGTVSGVSDVPVVLNGVPARVDFRQSDVITIEPITPHSPSLRYDLAVRHDGKVVAELSGNLDVERDPDLPAGEIAQIAEPDLAVGGQSKGPLSFRAPIVVTVPGMKFFTGLCLADMDHDGHLDILVTSGTDLVVLYGQGDGKTFEMIRYPMGEGGGHLCTADLNHDGRTDVVVSGGHSVQVLLSTGPRRFAAPRSYPTGEGASCVTVGDFNGDGAPDLAVTNMGASSFAVLLNKGDGTFGTAVQYRTPQYTVGIAAGDFNRDGKLDLAVNCYYSNTTLLFLGDGHGGFQQSGIAPETGGGRLVAADFNRDGHVDLAGLNYWSSGLGIALGDGKGNFSVQRTGTPQYPSQICVGDIDGDGLPDIAFGDQGTNSFVICLNGGEGRMKEGLTFTVSDGDVHGAVIGDLNEDGQADIVADGGRDHLFIFLNNSRALPGRNK